MAQMKCAACRLNRPLSDYAPSTRDPSKPKKICRECEGAPVGFRPGDDLAAAAQSPTGRAVLAGSKAAEQAILPAGVIGAFKQIDSMERAGEAIVQVMPQMLQTLAARAKAGDARSFDRLIELAGGDDAVKRMLSGKRPDEGTWDRGEREPSIFELMAMKPGQVTDSL